MPTAGRLAGAVIFGLFGWYLAGITVPFFPNAVAPSYWLPWGSFISLIIGWRICGRGAGAGYNTAMASGITASFSLAFCLLFALAFNQMITNAMRLRYNGVMDALVGMFSLMLEFAEQFYDITLIVTLFAGGIICAWITEYFGQRFP